jgi:hypothetical protein
MEDGVPALRWGYEKTIHAHASPDALEKVLKCASESH